MIQMAANMKYVLITGFLLIQGTYDFAVADSLCHISELGPCADHIVGYVNALPRRTMPSTQAQMDELCSAIKSTYGCFDDYKNRCMSPIQSELENLITVGAREYNAEFCAAGSPLIQKFMKNAECISKNFEMAEADEAIKRGLFTFETVDQVPIPQLVPYICCGWNSVWGTFMKLARDNCPPGTAESINDIVAAAVSTLPDMICASFDPEGDQCAALLPPKGSEPTGKSNPVVNGIRYFFNVHL